MSDHSEKVNKNWNVGAQFLLLLAILMSFLIPVLILIQIVGAWTAEPLGSLRVFFTYNQIIAIIILLVSVSLSYCLLLYMNKNPEKADKNWRQAVAWFLLPFTLLMSVLILFQMVGIWYPEQLKFLTVFKNNQIIAIITLLASVSLFSFLLQIYMSIDSEVGDKNWRQAVFWSLLLPALLMSVLILSIKRWAPDLLEPLRKFIINNQIFTIITLLASISLLSFLLQIYINKNPEKADKIWKIVAYPVHWVFRLAARFLLLFGILAAILMPFLILIILVILTLVSLILLEQLESFKAFIHNEHITIITLLANIGLLSFIVQKYTKAILTSLREIGNKILKVFQSGWRLGLNIEESLSKTWKCYVLKFWPFMKDTYTKSLKLIIAVSIFFIICLLFLLQIKEDTGRITETKEWRTSITTKLDNIEKQIANHPHKPTTSYRFAKNDSFSLVYREGNLETKEGICPEDSNLEWLELFKQAISDDSKDRHLKLTIKGFASVAPVPVSGIINDKSDALNCEIANQRAEALIYFLTTEPYDSTECKTVLNDSLRWGREEGKLCTRGRPDPLAWTGSGFIVNYDDSQRVHWKGPNLTVSYKPWESYDKMNKEKPLKNPPENSKNKEDRQLDREFLNRSVQIIIEEVSYRTKTKAESPAEDNTEQSN